MGGRDQGQMLKIQGADGWNIVEWKVGVVVPVLGLGTKDGEK